MRRSGNHFWIEHDYERGILIRKLKEDGYVFPSAMGEKWVLSSRHARRIVHLVAGMYLVFIYDKTKPGQPMRIMIKDITPAPKRRKRGNPALNPARWSLQIQKTDNDIRKPDGSR